MIKAKFSIGKLFYNDRFVMCFSVLVSFVLWLMVSGTTQETTIFTVTDIPVNLPSLSNDLKFFTSTDDITAEVKISGNTIIVASVTNSDIYVTPSDISFVTEPGTYKLNLIPKKSGIKTDYNFESTVTPSSIEVYADRYAEKEIPITDRIDVSSIDSSSYAATTVFSKQSVKVAGAESIINNIAEIDAEYRVSNALSQTTTVEANLVYYDANGHRIDTTYISSDIETVTATIPILRIKELEIIPSFTNVPDSFIYDSSCVTVSPSTIQVAVPEDYADSIEYIETEPIDISSVNLANNSYTMNIVIPSGCKNINQVTKANITFERNQISAKNITINKFTVINEGNKRNATVSTKSINVTLIGAKDQISSINSSNLTAVIDMSQKTSPTGFVEMPVTISINSKFSFVWVVGSYEVNINITEKSGQESS